MKSQGVSTRGSLKEYIYLAQIISAVYILEISQFHCNCVADTTDRSGAQLLNTPRSYLANSCTHHVCVTDRHKPHTKKSFFNRNVHENNICAYQYES